MTTKACETCRWWDALPVKMVEKWIKTEPSLSGRDIMPVWDEVKNGLCRVREPHVGEDAWPITRHTDWCGLYYKEEVTDDAI